MAELITNLHNHTTYSDGHASHAEIAKIAIQAGLDDRPVIQRRDALGRQRRRDSEQET